MNNALIIYHMFVPNINKSIGYFVKGCNLYFIFDINYLKLLLYYIIVLFWELLNYTFRYDRICLPEMGIPTEEMVDQFLSHFRVGGRLCFGILDKT